MFRIAVSERMVRVCWPTRGTSSTRGGYGLVIVGSITLLFTAAAAFALSIRVAYLFLIEQRSLDSIAASQTLPGLLRLFGV